MQEATRAKKLLLFLSDGNPIWRSIDSLQRVSHKGVTNKKLTSRSDLLGIAAETLSKWRHREVAANPERLEKSFGQLLEWMKKYQANPPNNECAAVAKELEVKIHAFYESLISNSADVYSSGRALGLRDDETQCAIDTEIHGNTPLLRCAYYSDLQSAINHCDQYAGLYHAWIQRPPNWLQGTLEVRYVVGLRGGHIIRAKLNLPDLNELASTEQQGSPTSERRPVFEYDGWVKEVSPGLYWTFEKRDNTLQDFFYFITGRRARVINGHPTFDGAYLTIDQDSALKVVHDRIVLQRFEKLVRGNEEVQKRRFLARTEVSVLKRGDASFKVVERVCSQLKLLSIG